MVSFGIRVHESFVALCGVILIKSELFLFDWRIIPAQLLDRCTDGMAFGALKRCKECSHGHFSYK